MPTFSHEILQNCLRLIQRLFAIDFLWIQRESLWLKRRGKLGEEKQKVVVKEMKKLMKVGFIREIQYTVWLASMVMV